MNWRNWRAGLLSRLKVKPKRHPEPAQKRVLRALATIKATPAEIKQIQTLTFKAQERTNQRHNNNSTGQLEDDASMLSLEKEARNLLGEKRAEKFFRRCNDPYF